MNDREEWRERVRDIHATSAIWWYGSNGSVWKLFIFDRTVLKKIKKEQHKNVNTKIQWTWFPNLSELDNPIWVEMKINPCEFFMACTVSHTHTLTHIIYMYMYMYIVYLGRKSLSKHVRLNTTKWFLFKIVKRGRSSLLVIFLCVNQDGEESIP